MALHPDIIALFPNSVQSPFIETSPSTRGIDRISYNCIAWAYEDSTAWYWPHPNRYWPKNIPMTETLEAFQLLFEDIGYEVCTDDSSEEGFQKIAIFAKAGKPTHASRQMSDGMWTSKLGDEHDVSHTLQSMADGFYGNVAILMRKRNE